MTRILLALLLTLAAHPALSDVGASIFTGEPVALARPDTARKLARFPCHSCHGRDARGGIEGDVPAIDWATLSRVGPDRPAYDPASFHRAVTEGVAADGRVLSRLMPRFDLSRTETNALAQHLQRIEALQRRGVTADAITVGVASLGVATNNYLDALRATLRARLGGDRVYGRRVDLVVVAPGDTGTYDNLFVLLVAPTGDIAEAVARGLPVLAPFGPLAGNEDRSIVRAITPSRDVLLEALAKDVALASGPEGGIAILSGDTALAEEMEVAMRFAAPKLSDRIGPVTDAANVILLGGARLSPAAKPERIWIDQRGARDLSAFPEGAEVRVLLDAPDIALQAAETRQSPVLIHAGQTGTVLAEALKIAGRDLTRAGLFRAIDETFLGDIGLDYRKAPLTGTLRAWVMPVR